MLLGIVLHGAISFMAPNLPFWPVQDEQQSLLYAVPVFFIHAFRLQTFFMMAGFFALLLSRKRGLRKFASNRLIRIAIPLAIFSLTIIPLVHLIYILGFGDRPREVLMFGATGIKFDISSLGTKVTDAFSPIHFVDNFHFFHLWFLWYLVWMYLAFGVCFQFGQWSSRVSGFAGTISNRMAWLMKNRFRSIILAIPTVFLLWPMRTWTPDAPEQVLPQLEQISYYFYFFVIGCFLYHQREHLGEFFGGWKTHVVTGLLLSLPLIVVMQHGEVAKLKLQRGTID